MSYRVYLVRNTVNGMLYVGSTEKDIKRRWKTHCYNATYQHGVYPFYGDIHRFGPEQFTIELLEQGKNADERYIRETFWIRHLSTLHPHGYNMDVPRNTRGRGL